ncbi:MAG: hypothetical protein EP344_11480 [Bacteroidetes bacterium]|nr:MAG: hypothetical protein EP344_11480 [Bacteroidota bacterium]
MSTLKVVVFGNNVPPSDWYDSLQPHPVEFTPVPASYPLDRLEYLAPFQLILFHGITSSDHTLEQIRTIRRKLGMTPIILVAEKPSPSYLVQAYRYGITDCVLAPCTAEQISTTLLNYLPQQNPVSTTRGTIGITHPLLRTSNACPFRNIKADIEVRMLGTFQVYKKGKRLDLPSGTRQRSLLAFLLHPSNNPVHRDKIIRNFWPDHDPECARNNLNVGICNLRRYLEQHFPNDVIRFENGYFSLHPDLVLHTDIGAFHQFYQQGKTAERHGQRQEAEQFYRSATELGTEFLEEFQQEDWTVRLREIFTERYFHAMDIISSIQYEQGHYEQALETLRTMLYKDDCLESVHSKIMACYLASGKKEKAVRQYQECERLLWDKLNMRPSANMEELFQTARGFRLTA